MDLDLEFVLREWLQRAAKSADAHEADVFCAQTAGMQIEWDNGQWRDATDWHTVGSTARLAIGGRFGAVAATTFPDAQLLADAVAAAPFGRRQHFSFAPTMPTHTTTATANSTAVSVAVPPADLMPGAMTLAAAIGRDLQDRVGVSTAQVRVTVQRGWRRENIANSAGLSRTFLREATAVTATVAETTAAGMVEIRDSFVRAGVCDPASADIGDWLDRLAADFRAGRWPVPLVAGTYRVILAPAVVRDWLFPLLSAHVATPAATPVFDARLSVVDDPATEPGTPYWRPFDAEGVPTQRCAVFDRGERTAKPMHTLATAAAAGDAPTGHAVRAGLHAWPTVGLHAWRVLPGDAPMAELLADFDGLWIAETMGLAGDDAPSEIIEGGVRLGYQVIAGRRVGRLPAAGFRLHVPDAWRHQLIAISCDTHAIGAARVPFVLLDKLSVWPT